MVNNPLLRAHFLWGVAFGGGGVPLDFHDGVSSTWIFVGGIV